MSAPDSFGHGKNRAGETCASFTTSPLLSVQMSRVGTDSAVNLGNNHSGSAAAVVGLVEGTPSLNESARCRDGALARENCSRALGMLSACHPACSAIQILVPTVGGSDVCTETLKSRSPRIGDAIARACSLHQESGMPAPPIIPRLRRLLCEPLFWQPAIIPNNLNPRMANAKKIA